LRISVFHRYLWEEAFSRHIKLWNIQFNKTREPVAGTEQVGRPTGWADEAGGPVWIMSLHLLPIFLAAATNITNSKSHLSVYIMSCLWFELTKLLNTIWHFCMTLKTQIWCPMRFLRLNQASTLQKSIAETQSEIGHVNEP